MSPHQLAQSRSVLLVVVLLLVLAACAPAPAPPPVPEGWQQHVLTADGSDAVELRVVGADAVTVSAPRSNSGENLRVLFTRSSSRATAAQEVCANFADSGGIVQEGIAFDIRRDGDRTRVITVTKNIWLLGNWRFNVHEWDTARARPFRHLGSLDMSHVVGHRPQGAATWRLCGRLIGTKLEVSLDAVSTGTTWTSPAVRSVTVPRLAEPGRAGWYVGHLRAGDWVRFASMRIGEQARPPVLPDAPKPDPTPTPDPHPGPDPDPDPDPDPEMLAELVGLSP